jgi:hypothetical protein
MTEIQNIFMLRSIFTFHIMYLHHAATDETLIIIEAARALEYVGVCLLRPKGRQKMRTVNLTIMTPPRFEPLIQWATSILYDSRL